MNLLNLEEAKKEFIKFTENYDLTVESIKRKQCHSLRVMELSKEIATKEGFSETEIELATLIGLLHDIARFKQYTEYQTFSDAKSFDHGDVAIDILEKDNLIRTFIKTSKYDNIIKASIKNHNKRFIEKGLTHQQNKFCKLIRDADKLDIIFLMTQKFIGIEKDKMENSKLNPEIKKQFDKNETIDKSKNTSVEYADRLIQTLALIFDINYNSSFEILKREKYIEKLTNSFNFKDNYTKESIIDAKKLLNEYMFNKNKEKK